MAGMMPLAALLLLLAPFLPAADADLEKAEKTWAAAITARDFQALDQVFAPDLIYAHSTGAIESKQDYVARLRSGAQRYDTVRHEKIRVVAHGNSAATHSIVRMIGSSNGKPFNDHLMVLHYWVNQGGRWRLAAHQSTKLAE